MSAEIPKQYEPAEAHAKWTQHWLDTGCFDADPTPGKDPHTIMIPLPNVTGALHMGHALNGTLQDLITRRRRMQGYEALWMPGTDHAGIATQAVVERRMLEEEGLTRHDIGREALVNRIWKWKESYEARILGQLQAMGASCDWRRTRFTLDDVCAKAVRRTFFKMFSDGKIFRGKRLVNWDPFLQTAVADDELYEEDVQGNFWTFHYPVVDEAGKDTEQSIKFSTTRPETMLGDTAVCVHPTDERYVDLIGKHVRLPLSNRTIPIIADALLADKEKGTGAVKVTPAHDPNDYACGLRNDLPSINILNPDGSINEEGGEKFEGLDRFDARKAVIAAMEELGFYDGVEDRVIPLKHSDRSKTPVEPYLSDQWFVKMDELAQSAMDAVEDGRVRFYPSRYAKTYLDWLGEKRDWCISRQLWWGHRIPVWSHSGEEALVFLKTHSADGGNAIEDTRSSSTRVPNWSQSFAGRAAGSMTVEADGEFVARICVADGNEDIEAKLEAAGFEQDPDVLDTWFSSALWPHATLGWPDLDQNPPLRGGVGQALPDGDASGVGQPSEGTSDAGEQGDAVAVGRQAGPDLRNDVLDYFYPGNVLVTSRDIITLWVARMVLTGLYNMGDVFEANGRDRSEAIPFKHVCIHPKIMDAFGKTMSKSKGNGADPVDLVEKYGADAVRFTLASLAGETQDVRLVVSYQCPHCEALIAQTQKHQNAKPKDGKNPKVACQKCKKESEYTSPNFAASESQPVAKIVIERFEYGRNFCNKLWNAARFAMLNLEGYEPSELPPVSELPLEDRWVLSRLSTTLHEVDTYLDRYQFDAATRSIRDFVWNEFCDWYLEMVKVRLRDNATKPLAQRVLAGVLDSILRLLQPFTPYVCEELWHRLGEFAPERALFVRKERGARGEGRGGSDEADCISAAWPELPSEWQDEALEKRFARLQDTIVAVRNVRAVYDIPPGQKVKLLLRTSEEVAGDIRETESQFDQLARVVIEAAGAEVERPAASASFSLDDADGFIPLEGLIDRDKEVARQQKEADRLTKLITGSEKKLSNENFVAKAPPEVIAGAREQLESLKGQLASVEQILSDLA